MAAVEPLPLVPVRCSTGYVRWGSPRRVAISRMRSSVGTARRSGIADSRLMCPSSHRRASSSDWKRRRAIPKHPGRPKQAKRTQRTFLRGCSTAPAGLHRPVFDRDQCGIDPVQDNRTVDHALTNVVASGEVIHDLEEDLLQDGPKASRTGTAKERLLGDCFEGIVGDLELHAIEFERPLVLLGQSVLWFDEDPDEGIFVQLGNSTHYWEPPDEFRDQPELDQVFRKDSPQNLCVITWLTRHLGAEADPLAPDSVLDDLVEPGKGSSANEQNIGGVDLDEFLVRVLPSTLRGNRCRRSFEDLEERLLDTLARNVTGDGGVLALPSDLVNLVDIDDPGLRAFHVVISCLNELEQDVLDVFAHVASLGKRGGICNGKGDVEHPCQGLGKQSLATSSGPEQQDVRLRQLDVIIVARGLNSLVVVVNGYRENLLGMFLTNDVVIEEIEDLSRLGELVKAELSGIGELLGDDVVAQIDAFIADVDTRTCDELLYLLLRLSAEAALAEVTPCTQRRYGARLPSGSSRAPLTNGYAAPTASRGVDSLDVMTSSTMP